MEALLNIGSGKNKGIDYKF